MNTTEALQILTAGHTAAQAATMVETYRRAGWVSRKGETVDRAYLLRQARTTRLGLKAQRNQGRDTRMSLLVELAKRRHDNGIS